MRARLVPKPWWSEGVLIAVVTLAPMTGSAQEPPLLPTLSELIVPASDFGRPSQVSVGPSGDLYAAYPARGELLIVPSDGRQVRVIPVPNADGADIPFWFGWLGDTVYVTDFRGHRLKLLDRVGRIVLARAVTVPQRQAALNLQPPPRFLSSDRYLARTDPGGNALAAGNPRRPPPPWAPAAEPVDAIPLLILDGGGRVERTLAYLPVRNQVSILAHPGEEPAMSRRFIWHQEPFADQPLFALDPTGTHAVIVEREVEADRPVRTYTLHRISLDGDTLVSLRHSVRDVELRQEWKADAVEEATRLLGGDLEAARAVAWATLHFPRSLPPVSEVRIDPEGWVWIGRERVPGADLQRWEIVSPANARVAIVDVPSNFNVRSVWRTTAWATLAAGTREDPQLHLWRFTVQLRGG
jgi:hypothetical protein